MDTTKMLRLLTITSSRVQLQTHLRNSRKILSRCVSTTSKLQSSESTPSSTNESMIGHAGAKKAEKISMAMKAYLENAKAHDKFMKEEIADYEIGKRHLAHIMGADPENFSQEEIDRAVEYLFPSGLFNKKARPLLKHPLEVIPNRKTAQFGMDGRPFHFLFYTGRPNFYQIVHDAVRKLIVLKEKEDAMISRGQQIDMKNQMILADSQWVNKHVLSERMQEKVDDHMYASFVALMERLASNPLSNQERDFIMQYRQILAQQSLLNEIPTPIEGESGRSYIDAEGQRKTAKANVRLHDKGTGIVTINGKDFLSYFPSIQDREQVMFPLQFVDKLNEVDIEATVEFGSHSSQAGAIRLGISTALQSFVDRNMSEKMRLAGLLTRDPRTRERKKPGQEGARRKFTWKKR